MSSRPDAVYLDDDYYGKPKELVKFIVSLAVGLGASSGLACDVGCGDGAFCHHLLASCPELHVLGFDPSSALIDKARQFVPAADFLNCRLEDEAWRRAGPFDLVTMSGVLSYYDEPLQVLGPLLSSLRQKGVLIVVDNFNPWGVDSRMRYRVGPSGGWIVDNSFCHQTIEESVAMLAPEAQVSWHAFEIPFDLPRQADPVRTWTLQTNDKPRQLVSGTGRMINIEALAVRKA